RGSVGTEILAGRFTGPGAGIYLAHHGQHFFGGRHGLEVAHVQAETFAAILAAAAHEKGVLRERGVFRLRQRHRRRRRGQIDDITALGGCTGRSRQCVHDVIWLGTHGFSFPERPTEPRLPPQERGPSHSLWSVRTMAYTVNGRTEHAVAVRRPKYSSHS